MGDKSGIQWTDATWNPVTGCSKVSPGCAHCYAETLTKRYAKAWGVPGLPWTPANAEQNVILKPERLDQPLRWTKPRMVFVNSMSDLFHEQVPDEYIAQVFGMMAASPQHTFQVLTKRPERMRDLLASDYREAFWSTVWETAAEHSKPGTAAPVRLPDDNMMLTNVWLGTSIENRRFVHRADLLRETPAAVRFISAEPLLGPLVHDDAAVVRTTGTADPRAIGHWSDNYVGSELDLSEIDWLIVGGESGPGHRPMQGRWVRDLRDACLGSDPMPVFPRGNRPAFFFKQWGGATPKSGGRELDGRTWDEMPEVAR